MRALPLCIALFALLAILHASPAESQPSTQAADTQPAQDDRIFLERDGAVIVEVESAAPSGGWKAETELKGFTGRSYYTWRGGDLFNQPGSGVLAYRIRIFAPGVYNLRIHNRHDFHDATEENDVWTRLDDGKWIKTYSSWRGRWVWHTAHELDHATKVPASFELTAGDHILSLSGRSKNFSVDRFVLYRGGDPNAGRPKLEGPESAMLLDRVESPSMPPTPTIRYPARALAAWEAGRLDEAFMVAGPASAEGVAMGQACEMLGKFIEERFEAAKALQDSDPLAAVAALRQLAAQLGSDWRTDDVQNAADELARTPAARDAQAAADMLADAQRLAEALPDAKQAQTQPALQQQRDTQLKPISEKLAEIRAKYPNTQARWRAETLATELGLEPQPSSQPTE